MGAAGTIITVHTFYENIDWKLHGIPAKMVLSETQRKIVIAPSDMSTQFLDVKYVSAQGNLLVRQQILSGPNAHALLDGRSIPLTYIKGNPMRIRYGDDDSPSPWGWLILTIGAFFAAFVGKKMLHKQAGVT
jgi:hypothetical protein